MRYRDKTFLIENVQQIKFLVGEFERNIIKKVPDVLHKKRTLN